MNSGVFTAVLERSRPGIRFEVAAPSTPEALPRMDVAAFIGFAERGPLHCPVAVEDMVQFEKVFGSTPKLGWAENGEQISGLLAESVNSFFVQGGLRCWIVRVAGASASSNQFILPDLYKVTHASTGYKVLPAIAQASCAGSWSDSLRVATRIQTRPIFLKQLGIIEPAHTWEIRTFSDIARTGDLLRIVRTVTIQTEEEKHQAFFPITAIERNKLTGEIILSTQQGIAFKNSQGKQADMGGPSAWLDGIASLVSIDIRVRDVQSSEWRVDNLGLTPLHPRYCGALQTDLEEYRSDTSDSASSQPLSSSASVSSAPWFPLAAMANDSESETGSFMVPLGMLGGFSREENIVPNSTSELERDGLEKFDTSLFIDPSLYDASVADLLATADAIRYSAPVLRPLTGMHAVLGWFNARIQDEVTLIAVPDAVHEPWQGRPQALHYTVTVTEIASENEAVKSDAFVCCNELVAPNNLSAIATNPSGTTVRLSWEMTGNSSSIAIEYQVQESANKNFLIIDQTTQAVERELDIVITAPGWRSFRVRAISAAQTSLWSSVIALNIVEADTGGQTNSMDRKISLEIQRELIKLCAAQGELFAVLSLPKKMTEREVLNHVQSLTVTSSSVTSANSVYFDPEGRIGSYAAIYHPWVETRSSSGSVNPLPPDGAILGMLAARTRERGVWIAPANRVLNGVVALHNILSEAQQTQLADAGINLMLHRPEGFTLLSEETLSNNVDLRPVHVRRLLIMMRRIMMRLGEEFTFETNNLELRALIRQRCYNMLERMYRSGAFAGRNAAESFQVSIEDNDNPQASIDAGRLVIRIRISPAQALRFITIRFTLGGANGVVEESTA